MDRRQDERVPALVLGVGHLALGALRALSRKGVPVYAGSERPAIERFCRWYRPVPGGWSEGSLQRSLRGVALEGAVLMPTSEVGAIAAASLPPDLKHRFPSSTPGAGLLRTLWDKSTLAEVLVEHDVPHPRTWSVEHPSDLDELDDGTLDRVFLKPRDSGRFSATFGRKSLRPRGREAIAATLAELTDRGFDMVLQEWIPGPPTSSYLVDGFIDRFGVVQGVMSRQRLRQWPLDFGNSCACRTVARETVAEAEDTVLNLLRTLGHRGPFGAEFKWDARDGSFKLIEINVRTWLHAEFAARCGVDTLTMAYEDALELPVTPSSGYDVDRTIVQPHLDLLASHAMWRSGDLGLGAIAGSWIGADQLTFAWDDPRPWLTATSSVLSGYIGRRLPWRRRERPERTQNASP